MIKILYDFNIKDILQCKYLREPETNYIIDLNWKTNLLTTYDSPIISLQFLGGGSDSVTFVNNENYLHYIIEPANGLIIAYDFINVLTAFELKRQNNLNEFKYNFSLGLDETIFRHHRNDDEFFVEGVLSNHLDEKLIKITLNYVHNPFSFECNYLEFIPELFLFAAKVYNLYDFIIPEFKHFKVHDELHKILFGDNILRQKYSLLLKPFDNSAKSFVDYIPRDVT